MRGRLGRRRRSRSKTSFASASPSYGCSPSPSCPRKIGPCISPSCARPLHSLRAPPWRPRATAAVDSETEKTTQPSGRRGDVHRGLAAAIAILAIAAAPAVASQSYSGLGATRAAFRSGNHTTEPPVPASAPGDVWFTAKTVTRSGHVSAIEMQEVVAGGADSERDRVVLASLVPKDAVMLTNHSDCIVWKSATLKRLLGMSYAAATTTSLQEAGDVETAYLQSEAKPSCSLPALF